MSEKQLAARDAKRDLGAELLQAAREMKAGKGRVVWRAPKSRKGKNPRLGESFDTFLREQGIYESVQKTAKRRLQGMASADIKQHVTARRRPQTKKDYDRSRGKHAAVSAKRRKTPLSIYINDTTLARLKGESERTGKSYQTLINEALARSAVSTRPVTASQVRTIVREELAHRARSWAPPKVKAVAASIRTK